MLPFQPRQRTPPPIVINTTFAKSCHMTSFSEFQFGSLTFYARSLLRYKSVLGAAPLSGHTRPDTAR